jgi:signal transduction histidine kinase
VIENVAMHPLRRFLHALAWAAVLGNALLVVVWTTTGAKGPFWPAWVMLVSAFLIGVGWWIEKVQTDRQVRVRFRGRALALAGGLAAIFCLFQIGVWVLAGRGYFWPAWVILVAGVGLAILASVAKSAEDEKLTERVEELRVSRAGAVDAAEAQLRRIERDLHDGAQARLVALGMNIGLAEQQLGKDPDRAAEHLADARAAASAALKELRDLARGIHPPILADRGLGPAIDALAIHAAIPVSVDVELDERPPAAVETAAYFVAAEGLANALKHSEAARIDVGIHRRDESIVVRVLDDGHGGASEENGGLRALRQRVEALDGSLRIASPEGGPTVVEAVLPCAR